MARMRIDRPAGDRDPARGRAGRRSVPPPRPAERGSQAPQGACEGAPPARGGSMVGFTLVASALFYAATASFWLFGLPLIWAIAAALLLQIAATAVYAVGVAGLGAVSRSDGATSTASRQAP